MLENFAEISHGIPQHNSSQEAPDKAGLKEVVL